MIPDWANPKITPPQYQRDDFEIWRAWLPVMVTRYQNVDYSFRLGGKTGGEIPGSKYAGMWREVTARRVDAVGYTNGRVDLIEFRRNAGPSAIGQLIIYQALWKKEIKSASITHMLLVTDRIDPDLVTACDYIGIEVQIVAPI